jgi:opacity protein-like surface antigen
MLAWPSSVGSAHGTAHADVDSSGGLGNPPTKSQTDATRSAQRVGLETGLAAEKKLAENLAVRVEFGLLGAGYDHDSDETSTTPEGGGAATDKSDSSGFDVGLRPSATLSLHLMF